MVANAVKGVDGQTVTVTVTYKGGEKKIDIPVNVPVVAVVPASKDDIAPGGIVFVPSVELRVVQLQPDVLQLYHPQKTAGCARSLGVLVLSNQPVEVG
jgi:hypothetical protein